MIIRDNNKISSSGIKAIKEAYPGTKIEHDNYDDENEDNHGDDDWTMIMSATNMKLSW